MENAIGSVVLAMAALSVLTLCGRLALTVAELLAGAASWFGAPPAVGWAILGAILGALAGVYRAMLNSAKTDSLRWFYLAAVLILASLAAAGWLSPAGRSLSGR